ncbi:MAG: hypothetical protein AAFV85_26785 [Cyanobacteria bacterium J06634_6]
MNPVTPIIFVAFIVGFLLGRITAGDRRPQRRQTHYYGQYRR